MGETLTKLYIVVLGYVVNKQANGAPLVSLEILLLPHVK